MKINPQTETLAKILDIATRAVKHNGAVAVLGSVLFDADKENSQLTVSATDMEISITVRAGECPVEESGKAAIRAGLLSNVVKSITDEHADISSTSSEATLSTENGSFTINAYNAEDFPTLPEFPTEKDSYFVVPAKALAKAIENVLPFASNDNTRPALTGALVTFEKGELHVATTDSYRLGVATKALSGAPKEKVSQIIPARGLKEVARLASMAEKMKVAITENQAMFSAQGVTISTRLIDASFPEYKKLMPPEFKRTYRINRKSFIDSMRRVNLFCANTNPPTPVRLSFNTAQESLMGDELVIAGFNSEIGQGREIISYSEETEGKDTESSGEGDTFTAAFNPSYLMAALNTAGGEDILFKFNEPLKPAMLFPAETTDEDADLKMLLMPMRDPGAEEMTKPAKDGKKKAGPAKGTEEGHEEDTGDSNSADSSGEASGGTSDEASAASEDENPDEEAQKEPVPAGVAAGVEEGEG